MRQWRIEIASEFYFPIQETGLAYGPGGTDACQFRYWQARFGDKDYIPLADFFQQRGEISFCFADVDYAHETLQFDRLSLVQLGE